MALLSVDTFAGVNGTLLEAHVDNLGNSWTKVASSVSTANIQGGIIKLITGGASASYLLNKTPNSADQVVISDVVFGAAGAFISLATRSNDDISTRYLLQLQTSRLDLYQRVAGVSTIIGTAFFTVPIGETMRLTLRSIGTTISAELYRYSTGLYLTSSGGLYSSVQQNCISVTNSAVSQIGKVGFGLFDTVALLSSFDNFSATDASPGSPKSALKAFAALYPLQGVPTETSTAAFTETADVLGYIAGNLNAADYYPCPWVDIVNNSRGFADPGSFSESATLPRDAEGWPTAASRLVVATDTFVASVPTGVYKGFGTWQSTVGAMTVNAISGATVTNLVTAGQDISFDLTVTSPLTLILDFSQGIKNLKIITAGYSTSNPPLLRDEALSHYKQFSILRSMDYMSINNSTETTWATRQPAGKTHGRKSWESFFAFVTAVMGATESKCKGAWINVPHQSDATYWTNLEALSFSALPVGAKRWLEYSNECSNTIFSQELYLRNTAVAEVALGGSNLAGGDQYNQRSKLYGRKSAQLAQNWLTARGANALGESIFPVVTALFVEQNHMTDALAYMNTYYGAPSTYLHTVSSAPYPQGTLPQMTAAADASAMLAVLNTTGTYSLATMDSQFQFFQAQAARYGLARCVAYEWGPHTHGSSATDNSAVKYAAHLDAGMGDLVTNLATKAWAHGWGMLCYYTVTPYKALSTDVNSLWAVTQSFGAASPKYTALQGLKSLVRPALL